jgi:hypothetical protein
MVTFDISTKVLAQTITIYSSTLIHDLQHHFSAPPLGYWFFQFSDIGTQDISIMLRSLIRQLSSSNFPSTVSILAQEHERRGSQPSLSELITCLNDVIQSVPGYVFIALDALDEYPLTGLSYERSKLLELVTNLATQHQRLRLLITSRPEPDILVVLGRTNERAFDIEAYITGDIEQYVDTVFRRPEYTIWGQKTISRVREKLLSFEER